MRGRSVLQVVAMVLATLFPAVILAQTSSSDPQTTGGIRDRDRTLAGARAIQNDLGRANFHHGPWYLLSRIQLSDIGFTEEFFVPTGDHGEGLALSAAAPTRLYLVPTRKVVFSGEFVPGVTYFTANEGHDNSQFNYSARGGVQFLFNHLFLDLYAAKADQLRPRIADVNRLATLKSNETGVSGELKYSSRTSMTFSTRFVDSKYPRDRHQPNLPLDLLDGNARESRLQFVHKTLPRTSLTIAGENSVYDFDHATYKNATRTYVAPGFLYDARKLTLRAEAGPARLRFDNPTQRDYQGVLGQIALNWNYGRTAIGFGAERNTDFTIFAENNYYILTRAGATIERTTTRRLKLRAASSAERDTYDIPVFGNRRVDEASFTSVGFRYTLRRLTTGIDVGYYERTSTYAGDTGDGIRYILHLSFSP